MPLSEAKQSDSGGSQAFDSTGLERAPISLDLIDVGVFLCNGAIVLAGVCLSVIQTVVCRFPLAFMAA